ncbi:hypothetical protein A2331_06195 [Candidatus Falkowbacteria bacterium RIFOXYB2_FULL_34_18]|uniref:DDH domain-containing protein n=1 Tax=Candidatus Falkowbacteria bacterium RIFOXYD2_FULL_34_120 TaxID=1798007 RepID=A0A1F5TNM7_9BACT|nr:MAG: hypothetical protein A2331_06195 [Candidatus Falkowbacteria bacterium RIFOXYB2_FULL_34_18]OGF28776.1 MAG: hypothetical protein A2500_04505 [Candidatus Falkowbacteria bacterium RIFOXYC12_FULL_34_55]OGF35697.1 MAG: hypothetical protein A2466_05060 [Candidatus Falkowbacteria bacterium RIFOXYC2_FULL_34_220]OGF38412.1 MAG: hypothetical protein A2515_00550 [Candidatus Falkowbacteria bacterium RIFOXYD12_FULL_34_57]OGF40467.1 MAG: hypothetical protein A2531_03030 [Candidatus Falkowbacteria bact
MLTQEQQIFDQIQKANNILITFRKTWNGDAVASALAMFLFLKKMNKKAGVVAEKFQQNKVYSFLPEFHTIEGSLDNLRNFIISLDISNAKVGQIKYTTVENKQLNFIISPKDGFFSADDITSESGGFKYDLIISLDTPDLESLGKIYDNDTEFFYKIPLINIDHHSANEAYGQINYIEVTSVSTAEILFSLFMKNNQGLIDEDIATCLLAGIISKTRSFKTEYITPQALSVASRLISMGARREEIVNHLYRSRSLNVLKIWGRVLARLKNANEGKLVWSILTRADFEKTSTDEQDLDEVVDELISNIPQAKVVVILYESKQGDKDISKALVYSIKNINSLDLVKSFESSGTKNISKVIIQKDIKTAEEELIKVIEDKLNKLPI